MGHHNVFAIYTTRYEYDAFSALAGNHDAEEGYSHSLRFDTRNGLPAVTTRGAEFALERAMAIRPGRIDAYYAPIIPEAHVVRRTVKIELDLPESVARAGRGSMEAEKYFADQVRQAETINFARGERIEFVQAVSGTFDAQWKNEVKTTPGRAVTRYFIRRYNVNGESVGSIHPFERGHASFSAAKAFLKENASNIPDHSLNAYTYGIEAVTCRADGSPLSIMNREYVKGSVTIEVSIYRESGEAYTIREYAVIADCHM